MSSSRPAIVALRRARVVSAMAATARVSGVLERRPRRVGVAVVARRHRRQQRRQTSCRCCSKRATRGASTRGLTAVLIAASAFRRSALAAGGS